MNSSPRLKRFFRFTTVRHFCVQAPKPLVFVPTMGALHEGHAALVRRARALAGPKGSVAVSLFVNPRQFGPKEDFSRYPRTLEADARLCEREGANALFALETAEMYPADFSTEVNESLLSEGLCGATRPGHFRGVTTVVTKLFNLVQPDIAVFGQKDWQQLAIIRRMVRDLNFPIRLVGVPTVREADGLALSSRNQYLTPAERAAAPEIYDALRDARLRCRHGEKSVARLLLRVKNQLSQIPGGQVDYVELVDAATLQPIRSVERVATLAVAFKFGQARLIDNVQLR